jgi:4-diphosphocytidyl-2-C-methyl-D-erythritol kinase
MVSFPPCKINLGLNILRKRSDGFHEIETCFFPVPFTDILEIIKSKTFSFSSSGISIPGGAENNLCVRAYELLNRDYLLPPVKIHLHKAIPAGAGLGGGSSDAAHMLRLLNGLFNLGITNEILYKYAASLGSDCAFFISDEPMTARGRGEILAPVSLGLSGKALVLMNPGVHVSTAEAYAGVTPAVPVVSVAEVLHLPISSWKELLRNDFEPSVFSKFPQIGELKTFLYSQGAQYASMSGSGSSVFGIFEREPDFVTAPGQSEQVLWKGTLL